MVYDAASLKEKAIKINDLNRLEMTKWIQSLTENITLWCFEEAANGSFRKVINISDLRAVMLKVPLDCQEKVVRGAKDQLISLGYSVIIEEPYKATENGLVKNQNNILRVKIDWSHPETFRKTFINDL